VTKRRLLAALGGPALCAAIVLAPTPAGLAPEGQAALAVLILCVVWWVASPVPLPVTSLVGLALLPALGAMPAGEALALFGNQAVFFVIGVFLVAAALLQTGLSARLTLLGLRRLSNSEDALCLGVQLVSWALCSIMVSHAVAAILLPIVLELIRALDLGPRSRTAKRLLLGMAWGTVAGSNLTLLSSARASLALELYSGWRADAGLAADPIGFAAFSAGAAPISLFSLVLCAVVLRLVFPPEGLDLTPAVERLDERVRGLGAMDSRQWMVLAVLGAMLAAMVGFGPAWLGVVALLASAALFLFQVLRWEDAERYVNWGVILMYGGAIAVGGALHRTGATTWLAARLLPDGVDATGALGLVGIMSAGLTEIVSNAAVIAVVLPVALPLAPETGLDPRALAWAVPIAAGLAFVLPTSTPAMAMVFGTGYLRVRHTLAGLAVTFASLGALLIAARFLWPLLGLHPTEVP
jgi:solute carrier family 13 (sodium-dependent dicarboxylate transporter), member 2/3/5